MSMSNLTVPLQTEVSQWTADFYQNGIMTDPIVWVLIGHEKAHFFDIQEDTHGLAPFFYKRNS